MVVWADCKKKNWFCPIFFSRNELHPLQAFQQHQLHPNLITREEIITVCSKCAIIEFFVFFLEDLPDVAMLQILPKDQKAGFLKTNLFNPWNLWFALFLKTFFAHDSTCSKLQHDNLDSTNPNLINYGQNAYFWIRQGCGWFPVGCGFLRI